MDDRRFDSLTKALAAGKSRRSVLKGLLGLGGVAAVGTTLLEGGTDAARRPTPTPKPPACPGQQVPCPTGCCCPAGLEKCGPDCCATSIPSPQPGHSECCDSACCFGTCYGEELCCATNNRSSGEFPIPPTNKICNSINNGIECCEFDQPCCTFDGCCDTVCWGDQDFACCPNDPISFCQGGASVPDICCVNEGDQLFACCNGGTDARVSYDTSAEGACCTDADCGDPCQVCNPATNICEPRCDAETEVCCTDEAGASCTTGRCCLGEPCPNPEQLCCQTPEATFCLNVEVCPLDCDCPEGTTCCRESPTAPILCVIGDTCACDNFCGPIETDANNGNFYCCTEPDYTICCEGPESECCGGPAGRQCQPNGHCCEAAAPYYCSASGTCCAFPCDDDDLCPETQLCLSEGGSCPNAAGLPCCVGLSCCGGQCCSSASCCEGGTLCCGLLCDRCDETDMCVEDCRVGLCLCLEGQTCDQQTGLCVPDGDCEPNCLCGDGVVDPATDGLVCNNGGGECACGWCVVPLPGCPCGCAGDTECVQCDGNGGCALINQGGSCNGGAGICEDVWCVDAPVSCQPLFSQCSLDTDCCSGLCDVTSLCVDCKQPGGSCVNDSDCCNNNCDENACSQE